MSKHPEFVQSLVLKPWMRQMYSNYISFKKIIIIKSSCGRSIVFGIYRRRKGASIVFNIDVL